MQLMNRLLLLSMEETYVWNKTSFANIKNNF